MYILPCLIPTFQGASYRDLNPESLDLFKWDMLKKQTPSMNSCSCSAPTSYFNVKDSISLAPFFFLYLVSLSKLRLDGRWVSG